MTGRHLSKTYECGSCVISYHTKAVRERTSIVSVLGNRGGLVLQESVESGGRRVMKSFDVV